MEPSFGSLSVNSPSQFTVGPIYAQTEWLGCENICAVGVGVPQHCSTVYGDVTTSQDFSLSISGVTTVTPPATAYYTVTAGPQPGFNGSISLSASALPPGATSSFTQTQTNVWTAAVTVPANTPPGTYPVTIQGMGGGFTHSVSSSLVVAGPSFTIQAVPISPAQSPPAVPSGGVATFSVMVNPMNGYNGTVSLSSKVLPAGMTVNLDDRHCCQRAYGALRDPNRGYGWREVSGRARGGLRQ